MRIFFALSGIAYLARGLMEFGSPRYYDPATLFDYAAVITTTLAMLSLAVAIILLPSAVPREGVFGLLCLATAIFLGTRQPGSSQISDAA